jgi:hypothetical protein
VAGHCLTRRLNEIPSTCKAIELIRHAQSNGRFKSFGYVQAVDGDHLLWTQTPPFIHDQFVVVPPEMPAYFHYGLDSMCHVDIDEYIKWFYYLAKTGQV